MLLNIGGHGLGDCFLALQISYLLKERNIPHVNCISTREQVFDPLKHITNGVFELNHISEDISSDNKIVLNQELQNQLKTKFNCSEITYNVPDLLFKHPLALNYDKYLLNPQLIKKQRVLVSSVKEKENIIYCGLATSTNGYLYPFLKELLIELAEALPSYTIYFPNIKKWDREVNMGSFSNLPRNVFIDEDPKFKNSLDILKKSKYGIFSCNGPSHVAYHLGIPRLILDPQFNKLPWITRWKEDYEECIPLNLDFKLIKEIVCANINTPQTLLFDRKILANLLINNHNNWSNLLYFKFD
jgi:hypothetical protein